MRGEPVRWILGVLVLVLGAVGADAAPSSALGELLGLAEAAYERGDFARASELYQQALEEGADHPLVHYNLGNAWFKQGELGEAIASYVRAQRQAPRDARIDTNLRRARAQIRDRELGGGDLPAVLRPVPWLYGRFSMNEWFGIALAAYAFGLLALVGGHWIGALRRPGPWRARRWAGVLAVIALLAALMGTFRYRNEVATVGAVAVAQEIEVRSGPGRDYPLAFRIHEGLRVDVAEIRPDWVRIDLGGDLTGWVPASSLETL